MRQVESVCCCGAASERGRERELLTCLMHQVELPLLSLDLGVENPVPPLLQGERVLRSILLRPFLVVAVQSVVTVPLGNILQGCRPVVPQHCNDSVHRSPPPCQRGENSRLVAQRHEGQLRVTLRIETEHFRRMSVRCKRVEHRPQTVLLLTGMSSFISSSSECCPPTLTWVVTSKHKASVVAAVAKAIESLESCLIRYLASSDTSEPGRATEGHPELRNRSGNTFPR